MIIQPNEKIAIVGENGAGKSTLIRLLLRFYDVTNGEILINGTNIKDLNLKYYYKNIGVLFQDFVEYRFSVKNNIVFGNIKDKNNEVKMIESAKASEIHNKIESLKHKYNTTLGTWFKDGVDLSGGQWQRVALARMFFRDPNILILDEPTSAVDAKAEEQIFDNIFKNSSLDKEVSKNSDNPNNLDNRKNSNEKSKTVIIISHRFSTVRKADKIFVIENGQIIEQGSHKQLLAIKDGKYQEMFNSQAKGYK